MKIVYVISAYKYPDQLIRLVNRLNSPNCYFFVHIDKKTSHVTYNKVADNIKHLPNVYFLNRHKCYWGDFGQVLYALKGINAALDKKLNFDYLFLITGQDYPIKTNEYIERFLTENMGKQFIKHVPIPCDPAYGWNDENGGLDRIQTWSFRLFNRLYRIPARRSYESKIKSFVFGSVLSIFPKRVFPKNLQPYGGSSHWCITRECAEYIRDFTKKNPKFVKFFKTVFISDEIFFQTIVLNSYLKDTVINDDLRCIDWSSMGKGNSLPRIWCKEDLSLLSESNALIARKFDNTLDSEVLDLIDANLLSDQKTSETLEPA